MPKGVWKSKPKARKAKKGRKQFSVRWGNKSKFLPIIRKLRKQLREEKNKRKYAEKRKLQLDAAYTNYYDKYWGLKEAHKNVLFQMRNERRDYRASLQRAGRRRTGLPYVLSSTDSEESSEEESEFVEFSNGDDSTPPPYYGTH